MLSMEEVRFHSILKVFYNIVSYRVEDKLNYCYLTLESMGGLQNAGHIDWMSYDESFYCYSACVVVIFVHDKIY